MGSLRADVTGAIPSEDFPVSLEDWVSAAYGPYRVFLKMTKNGIEVKPTVKVTRVEKTDPDSFKRIEMHPSGCIDMFSNTRSPLLDELPGEIEKGLFKQSPERVIGNIMPKRNRAVEDYYKPGGRGGI